MLGRRACEAVSYPIFGHFMRGDGYMSEPASEKHGKVYPPHIAVLLMLPTSHYFPCSFLDIYLVSRSPSSKKNKELIGFTSKG